jgi:hypothetical protein
MKLVFPLKPIAVAYESRLKKFNYYSAYGDLLAIILQAMLPTAC